MTYSYATRINASVLGFVLAFTACAAAQAADVVVRPSAGSAFVITDSTGSSPRLRVQENGTIAIPGWQTLPAQAGQMCIDVVLGLVGPCAAGSAFSLPYAGTANSATPLFSLAQTGSGSVMTLAMNSNTNSSPAVRVSSAGLGNGVAIELPNNSGARGVDVQHNGVGPGVFANTVGGNSIWGVTGSISSAAVIGDSSSGEAIVGRQNGAVCNNNIGKCNGIGAVVGRHDGEGGYGVRGFVTNRNAGIGVLGQSGISGGVGVAGRFENVNAASNARTLEVSTNGFGDAVFISGGNNAQNLLVLSSNSATVARISRTGVGFFNGGTQTGGADIAEIIATTGQVPQPGDVVEIDPDHPLHYRMSSSAESGLVAGVVTTNPGVLMNAAEQDLAGQPALALAGRVPVKITLEGGAIRAGDLLVSASAPGHAKKAPANPGYGTVIGKALQNYAAAGSGVIQMLVMLR